ncbi:NHL domain-containing protein [Crossiella sp. CA198]|uniref:NHL domain-containing protein n=1 Tax=Crossiella sp. CA198 TaxID=3455607 RepID=UPI003F8D34AD
MRVREIRHGLLLLLSSATVLAALPLPATAATPANTPGVITTYAGNGATTGPLGDNGPAAAALLDSPAGLARDAAGNTYVAEYWGSRVRRITPAGVISTVAGTGQFGSGPDGGPATATQLQTPHGLAVDSKGNLYLSDYLASRVRKVSPQGLISTVAGTGAYGYGGDGGPAAQAVLNGPSGLAVDKADNLYIADTDNNRIRRITADGRINTVAGTGAPGTETDRLSGPRGVVVNAAGILFIADTGNNRVQLKESSPYARTIAGPGAPFQAIKELNGPRGLGLDPGDNLYIADTGNNRVLALTAQLKARAQAGDGTAGYSGDGGQAVVAKVRAPGAVVIDGLAHLFIADRDNHRVRRVQAGRLMTTFAGDGSQNTHGDGGPALKAGFYEPRAVAIGRDGTMYVTDSQVGSIRKITPAGIISTVVTGAKAPHGLAVDSKGNLFFVDAYLAVVRKLDLQGVLTTVAGRTGERGYAGDGGPATAALLGETPQHIALDGADNLYIADNANFRVRKVDAQGIITTFAGTGVKGYSGDGGPATAAQLNPAVSYASVAADQAGNVYLADKGNHRIRKINPQGVISTVAGTGVEPSPILAPSQPDGAQATTVALWSPGQIATDRAGNFYFMEIGRIRKVDPNGVLHTMAGPDARSGEGHDLTSGGDGGPIALAEFGVAWGLTLDAAGNLYVADGKTRTIRRIPAP